MIPDLCFTYDTPHRLIQFYYCHRESFTGRSYFHSSLKRFQTIRFINLSNFLTVSVLVSKSANCSSTFSLRKRYLSLICLDVRNLPSPLERLPHSILSSFMGVGSSRRSSKSKISDMNHIIVRAVSAAMYSASSVL